jgi:hypothetical protein
MSILLDIYEGLQNGPDAEKVAQEQLQSTGSRMIDGTVDQDAKYDPSGSSSSMEDMLLSDDEIGSLEKCGSILGLITSVMEEMRIKVNALTIGIFSPLSS